MEKDYKKWMSVKAELHNKNLRPSGVKIREIWIANIGENIGYEEDGKGTRYTRPVLIVSAFAQTCFVISLSTTDNRGRYYYAFDGHTGKTSVALLSQAQTIDTARLRRKIGYASQPDFDAIMESFKNLHDI